MIEIDNNGRGNRKELYGDHFSTGTNLDTNLSVK